MKLPRGARIELMAKWAWIVITDDLNRFTGQEFIKAAKNGRMTLGWWNLTHVDNCWLSGKHESLSLGFW